MVLMITSSSLHSFIIIKFQNHQLSTSAFLHVPSVKLPLAHEWLLLCYVGFISSEITVFQLFPHHPYLTPWLQSVTPTMSY